MKLVSLFALFAVANAGCQEACTKSATDADFVKEYSAKAEAAAGTLNGKIEAVDEAKAKQGEASAAAGSASLKASGAKLSHDKSNFLGRFFKGTETAKSQAEKELTEKEGALRGAKAATANAEAAKGGADRDIKSGSNAAKFAISSCVHACKAARAAAKEVFLGNPSNKFGVSAGFSIAAAGNEEPEQRDWAKEVEQGLFKKPGFKKESESTDEKEEKKTGRTHAWANRPAPGKLGGGLSQKKNREQAPKGGDIHTPY